jgi:peptidoglycan/LPS O-acetylase OafA/YrhL
VPAPTQSGRRYIPGLDGIRALAVLAVIAYHLGLSWAPGGMLGVGVFFTLSGYLITDLLLEHWERHVSLGLRTFWLHRARRLLPALFVMLAVVSVWVALLDAAELAAVRKQVFAATFYFSNWSTIVEHGSYFARFAAPLPLDHLWSLAIEEQFYLVWPWLLLLCILIFRTRGRLALVTLAMAVASAVAMAVMYHPGFDPTRVYEGTDTRAFGLLVGAVLAMVWPAARLHARVPPGARNLLDGIGAVGLVAIALLVWRTGTYSPFLYPTGFVLLSVATAAVVAAVVHPACRLGPILGWRPLRWVGVRSYAIYLWQWPIIVLTSPAEGHAAWPVAVLQVASTLAISTLSWRYVEEPVRHGAIGRLWRQLRSGASRLDVRSRALAASGATMALVLPVLGLTGILPAASAGLSGTGGDAGTPAALVEPGAHSKVVRAVGGASRTSCRSVVYLGDSTSEGEVSPDYIPNAKSRLDARLREVGVRLPDIQISGARSIVETVNGEPNAATVAQGLISGGYRGCWILAMGTNDTADVAVGSSVGQATRIARMMSIIGDHPVLWVDAISLRESGPYSAEMMRQWNRALLAACERFRTMRVFDWAARAKQRWFIPDGLHYGTPGSERRAHLIPQAMAAAFPARGQPSPSCVVR